MVSDIEILGEAEKHLLMALTSAHPEIEWKAIASICDKVIAELRRLSIRASPCDHLALTLRSPRYHAALTVRSHCARLALAVKLAARSPCARLALAVSLP